MKAFTLRRTWGRLVRQGMGQTVNILAPFSFLLWCCLCGVVVMFVWCCLRGAVVLFVWCCVVLFVWCCGDVCVVCVVLFEWCCGVVCVVLCV